MIDAVNRLQGIPASPGIAAGRVVVVAAKSREAARTSIDVTQIPAEQNKFMDALQTAKQQLTQLVNQLEQSGNAQEASILEGQLFLMDDPEIYQGVTGRMINGRISAAAAVYETFEEIVDSLRTIEDDYIRERVADIQDAKNRLLDEITGTADKRLVNLSEPSILLAHDITPSMTAQLNKEMVLGFVTEVGSRTSHTSIMARAFGIPAVVGCGKFPADWTDGEFVILDGEAGQVVKQPSEQQLAEYEAKKQAQMRAKESLLELQNLPAVTIDGQRIGLYGNIGTPDEVDEVLAHGGEGIGLFRTEFLFMDRDTMPSEEEQVAAYSEVMKKMAGKPVIIRTLDVGGDKEIPYLPIGKEFNPFMGWRAIRYCLSDTELFKVQLRAILRAAVHGDARVMFPMISGVREVEQAKQLLQEAKEELRTGNVPFDDNIAVGIMIEVPSAALVSDRLAQLVDFFSIGTNDLIQYTLAADRMNERVNYLYDARHPAVLRLIEMICVNAKKHGVHVGMCGEMAGDPALAPLLIGLGVEEWSMSAAQIPVVKKTIRELEEKRCAADVRKWLK